MSRRVPPGPHDQLPLFGEHGAEPETPAPVPPALSDADADARAFAVDPRHHVVLEASAGTGKTSVLVSRYINLLKAGIDPANILAITFTRKAAAEMRERIVRDLREAASRRELDRGRWIEIRDRLSEVAISTIDAFCLSLLREFPLEADLDPGFEMADETEVPRLVEEALDRAMRVITAVARTDADVALVLAQLGTARTREGLATLLDRRLVAVGALDRFLARGPADLTPAVVCRRTAARLLDVLRTVPGGLPAFLTEGPSAHPRYGMLVRDLGRLGEPATLPDAVLRGVLDRVAAHFLTTDGKPRRSGAINPYRAVDYPNPDAARRHRTAVFQIAPQVERVMFGFTRDLNVVLARGVRRMFAIALDQYQRALEERSVLDFSDVLQRAVTLLGQMDEFAQSRFRLESRYHHVLVDEFQDTSRAQWELVSLLIQSWGEGFGLAVNPSIFIVGDRKQSIYRFRDADVSVLQRAAKHIEALRPDHAPRRAIARSFRALPELLQFVNDVFAEIAPDPPTRPDDFTYGESDRFPVPDGGLSRRGLLLGISAAEDPEQCADAVAGEIVRILAEEDVRDRATGVRRRATAGDIAILFRSRASHREFERALEAHGLPTYVYKGLGFFDADETKDALALLRFLADPLSDLRAAALLRSRFVRLSDAGLARLAPRLSDALLADAPTLLGRLDHDDRRVLDHARVHVRAWLARADRVPPADLLEHVLRESAYAYELRGPRRRQAWENLKKMRGLVRRIQNRGYATLRRIADHLDALTAGDESNAAIEALDAVNLMTVHASKGLEFPIVFVVNMAKGASGPPKPVRVIAAGDEEPSVSIGPFVSEVDEADRARERHELRRLLYVALTRARDRLYLSSTLKHGAVVPGRGSLAEVLPPSLCALFARAASAFPGFPEVAWTSAAGHTFEFRICRSSPAGPQCQIPADEGGDQRPGLFAALPASRTVPATVTARMRGDEVGECESHGPDAQAGAIVHRMIRRLDELHPASSDERLTCARREARAAAPGASAAELDALAAIAASAFERLCLLPDVAGPLLAGERAHEVPFSIRDGTATVRGAIDCLVRLPDGAVRVLEFKTGRPRPAHQIQLDVYLRAARSMFPDRRVDGSLVYL